MLEQLLAQPPAPGDAAAYGKALHEIAHAVAEESKRLKEERLDVDREKQSQRDANDVLDNLRAIVSGVNALRDEDITCVLEQVMMVQNDLESLNIPQDSTAIKKSLSEMQVLTQGLAAKCDGLNDLVEHGVRRLDALGTQCAELKVSAASLQIDCRNAVVASVDATKKEVAQLRVAVGHLNQVVNALGQKIYAISGAEGELAAIYRGVEEASKAVAESAKGSQKLQEILTSDVAKARDEYKAKSEDYQAKSEEYKAQYEAECRQTIELKKQLQEVRDGPQMPSDASKTLDLLCSLVDQTYEEVMDQKNPRAVDRETIAALEKDIAVARGKVATQEDAKQVLRTLAQEAQVAGLERQELESLRAKTTKLETALDAANLKLAEEESRKHRWDMEMKRLAEDKYELKKEGKFLRAELRTYGWKGDEAPMEEDGEGDEAPMEEDGEEDEYEDEEIEQA